MPPVGFEPEIPANEGLQTYALDGAATGTGNRDAYEVLYGNLLRLGLSVWHVVRANLANYGLEVCNMKFDTRIE